MISPLSAVMQSESINMLKFVIFFSLSGQIICDEVLNNATEDFINMDGSVYGKENGSEITHLAYSSYVDNLISVLKDRAWSEDEKVCLSDMLIMLNGLKNSTLWAFWKWDSMSTRPLGVLYGTRYQLGNFDQCLSSPWPQDKEPLQTQYCLVDVILNGMKSNKTAQMLFEDLDPYTSAQETLNSHYKHSRSTDLLTYGVCLPLTCAQESTEKIVSAIISTSDFGVIDVPITVKSGNRCQDNTQTGYDAAFLCYIVYVSILVVVTCTCTYITHIQHSRNTLKMRIISAFCLKRNSKNLLIMKSGSLDVLYGIRFLTICFIVLGHQIGIYNGGGPTINGREFDQDALSDWGRIFLHFDVFVDTFYMMSGLLTVVNILSMKNAPNPILLILKRYVRLASGLAAVIFFVNAVFSYTGSGPLWPALVQSERGSCRRNWWLSLLMINNYVKGSDICIVTSWYVPTDFQFFLMAVILWCLYRKCKTLAVAIASLLAVASTVAIGAVTYIYKLSPIQTLTYQFLINQRENVEFNLTYITAHTRFAAYYVGLAAGYLMTHTINEDNRKRWSMKLSILGAVLGFSLMTTVMITGAHLVTRDVNSVVGALYAAINRPAWALGLVLLICSCSLGSVPLVSSFLSWYPWVPLSRLSYGLYLTHSLIILRNIYISRQPQYMDKTHTLIEASGVIVWGSVAALILWLLVEAPINNLFTIFMSPRSSETKQSKSTPSESNGRFKDKLMTTVQISKI